MANFYGGPRGLAGPKGDPGEVTLEYANNTFANAIKGVVSGGNAVRIDDISPLPHNIEVNAKRINLLNEKEITGREYVLTNLEVGKNYTLSYKAKDNLPEELTINLWNYAYASSQSIIFNGVVDNASISFTVAEGDEWVIEADSGNIADYIENIQLEEGIVATAYIPYVDTISFKTYGKNLIDYDVDTAQWEVVGDGKAFYFNVPCVSTFFVNRTDNRGTVVLERSNDNFASSANVAQASNLNRFKPCTVIPGYNYRLYTTKSAVNGKLIEWMQLEADTKATEYEPYKEPTEYAISADGTVEGVTVIYPTTTIVAPGARIEVKYNVDTKKYIDNKFSELQATLVNLI
jgi:hypothetical protein